MGLAMQEVRRRGGVCGVEGFIHEEVVAAMSMAMVGAMRRSRCDLKRSVD